MRRILKSSYRNLESLLPEGAGKALMRLVLKNRGKLKAYVDPVQHAPDGLGRGSVTFSLDFELAWAWRYSREEARECVALGLREREQMPGILAEFDRRDLPATWATVGHLFLSRCRRDPGGRAHPEIPPIAPFETRWWKYDGPDWFAHDPCSDVVHDPAWYAPDLIALLKASPSGHEIACHSFSHLGFGETCPHEAALAELKACRSAMDECGVHAETFVPPGNGLGNFRALKEAGFMGFRVFPWDRGVISLPVRRSDGLWVVPASACLENGDETTVRMLNVHRRWLELAVDAAVAAGLNAHLWFHPSIAPVQQEHILLPVLDYCAGLRAKGRLNVYTMRDLIGRTAALRPPQGDHASEGVVT